MPAVPGGAAVAGAGAAPPGGALPARQPGVPGGQLRQVLRAPQLRAQPHADEAPPPVGENENFEVELWLGQLTLHRPLGIATRSIFGFLKFKF